MVDWFRRKRIIVLSLSRRRHPDPILFFILALCVAFVAFSLIEFIATKKKHDVVASSNPNFGSIYISFITASLLYHFSLFFLYSFSNSYDEIGNLDIVLISAGFFLLFFSWPTISLSHPAHRPSLFFLLDGWLLLSVIVTLNLSPYSRCARARLPCRNKRILVSRRFSFEIGKRSCCVTRREIETQFEFPRLFVRNRRSPVWPPLGQPKSLGRRSVSVRPTSDEWGSASSHSLVSSTHKPACCDFIYSHQWVLPGILSPNIAQTLVGVSDPIISFLSLLKKKKKKKKWMEHVGSEIKQRVS